MPPAPARPAKDIDRPPFMVTLGLLPPYMAEDVEKAYLAQIKDIRPDLGGDRSRSTTCKTPTCRPRST